MKTTFYTDKYESVHGRKPAGVGRWCFRLTGTDNEIWLNGKYSEVKKRAANQAKSFGFYRIDVLP